MNRLPDTGLPRGFDGTSGRELFGRPEPEADGDSFSTGATTELSGAATGTSSDAAGLDVRLRDEDAFLSVMIFSGTCSVRRENGHKKQKREAASGCRKKRRPIAGLWCVRLPVKSAE